MIKVAIIGPECTGKTSISQFLAKKFQAIWIPEHARTYVEKLESKYTYEDVEKIAEVQFQQISALYSNDIVFFDTELIITKVWFDVVFKKVPHWLDRAIRESNFDLYLLCKPDIPWEPDSVRENGGENRILLYQIYKDLLKKYNFKYEEIEGAGSNREDNAFIFINKLIKQQGS